MWCTLLRYIDKTSSFLFLFHRCKAFNFKSALDASWKTKNPAAYQETASLNVFPGMFVDTCSLDTECGKCGKKNLPWHPTYYPNNPSFPGKTFSDAVNCDAGEYKVNNLPFSFFSFFFPPFLINLVNTFFCIVFSRPAPTKLPLVLFVRTMGGNVALHPHVRTQMAVVLPFLLRRVPLVSH